MSRQRVGHVTEEREGGNDIGLFQLFFCRVNIQGQMTMFAYYYIGIGLGVLVVSYFQVS